MHLCHCRQYGIFGVMLASSCDSSGEPSFMRLRRLFFLATRINDCAATKSQYLDGDSWALLCSDVQARVTVTFATVRLEIREEGDGDAAFPFFKARCRRRHITSSKMYAPSYRAIARLTAAPMRRGQILFTSVAMLNQRGCIRRV